MKAFARDDGFIDDEARLVEGDGGCVERGYAYSRKRLVAKLHRPERCRPPKPAPGE